LQTTINVISNKEDDQEEADDPSEIMTQQQSFSSRSISENSEKNKGKGREEFSSSYNPQNVWSQLTSGEDNGDSSSSDNSDEELFQKDLWHPKL